MTPYSCMSREELDRKLSGIQWRSVFRLLN